MALQCASENISYRKQPPSEPLYGWVFVKPPGTVLNRCWGTTDIEDLSFQRRALKHGECKSGGALGIGLENTLSPELVLL